MVTKKEAAPELEAIETKGDRSSPYHQGRRIKMAKPICRECIKNGFGWWDECPHDPYFDVKMTPVVVPVYEDVLGEDGEPNGMKRLVSQENLLEPKRALNLRQVPFEEGVNSSTGVARAQRKGLKHLQELGFAPMCEYLNCYRSNPTIKTQYGTYCSPAHARLNKRHLTGKVIPVSTHPKFWDIINSEAL